MWRLRAFQTFLVVAPAVALVPVAVAAEPVARGALVELFGSVACPDCVDARAGLTALESDDSLAVVTVEYHAEGPLANADAIARHAYYGAPTLPTAIFGGTESVAGGGDVSFAYRTLAETIAGSGSPLLMEASYNFDGESLAGTLNVDLQIPDGESVPVPAQWKIRAVIYEGGVIECCGPGGESSWPRVARQVLPDETLTAGVPGQVQFVRHLIPLNPAWDERRLGAIVFAQRDSDGAVLQAVVADDAGGLAPLPEGTLDESRVRALPPIPNPLTSQTRILFTLPRAQNARVRILDFRGALVRTLTDGPRPSGIHNVYWDGTDWLGRPAAGGMYLWLLEGEDGTDSGKLTLLR
ncbi:MAG: FlgD immunoglobulin-like domain containing protein [bacterium]